MTVDLSPWLDGVPQALVERLASARQVLAVTHEHPDADTIGATLAVCRVVEACGGSATPVSSDPIPDLYDFVPGIDRFHTDPDPSIDYDLVVLSDAGSLERAGAIATRNARLLERLDLAVIDHHASSRSLGGWDWIEPASAATCEMATLLAVRTGVPLAGDDGGLATALMAGIVMDTATFAHPNATPRTLVVSAALVEAGAPLSDISRRLYRTKPETQLRLFGRVLERLRDEGSGTIVWSTLLAEDIAWSGARPEHSEGIIDLLSQAESAEVTILFKEQADGTRLSVRTRSGGVDATRLTGAFGGGGHARAAGATLAMPVDAAAAAVLVEARRLVAELGR